MEPGSFGECFTVWSQCQEQLYTNNKQGKTRSQSKQLIKIHVLLSWLRRTSRVRRAGNRCAAGTWLSSCQVKHSPVLLPLPYADCQQSWLEECTSHPSDCDTPHSRLSKQSGGAERRLACPAGAVAEELAPATGTPCPACPARAGGHRRGWAPGCWNISSSAAPGSCSSSSTAGGKAETGRVEKELLGLAGSKAAEPRQGTAGASSLPRTGCQRCLL